MPNKQIRKWEGDKSKSEGDSSLKLETLFLVTFQKKKWFKSLFLSVSHMCVHSLLLQT